MAERHAQLGEVSIGQQRQRAQVDAVLLEQRQILREPESRNQVENGFISILPVGGSLGFAQYDGPRGDDPASLRPMRQILCTIAPGVHHLAITPGRRFPCRRRHEGQTHHHRSRYARWASRRCGAIRRTPPISNDRFRRIAPMSVHGRQREFPVLADS